MGDAILAAQKAAAEHKAAATISAAKARYVGVVYGAPADAAAGSGSDVESTTTVANGLYAGYMASTLNAERSALEQTLTLESGLNDAVLAARRQALVGYNDALHASDTTRLEMNYLITTSGANTTLEKRLTSLFGTFQMATRRSMASTSYDSDVLDDFYTSDVDWSIQTNRLRQQWYAANGSAKNAFNVAVCSASTTRQTRLLNAGTKYNIDVFDADEIYAKATTAAVSFSDVTLQNALTLSYNQEQIDLFGVTVPTSGIFSNPTRDYEVCFVAGTPVLMADGTKRPIETLRPGDMVLAADHLDPTSKPVPAKVVRFFDNGEKDVVRLHIGNEEILCTPEHPFYVVDKGWVQAWDLAFGDKCLNSDGKSVAFISRQKIAEKMHVYNLEVEGAHTYWVGSERGALTHNTCTICNGKSKINVATQRRFLGIGYKVENVVVDCPACVNTFSPDDSFTLFGNKLVAPWSPRASWNFADNVATYFNMMSRAAEGVAVGCISGAAAVTIETRSIELGDAVGITIGSLAGLYAAAVAPSDEPVALCASRISVEASLNSLPLYCFFESDIKRLHYDVREALNNNAQFLQLDLSQKFNDNGKTFFMWLRDDVGAGASIDFFLDGKQWVKQSDSSSKFHGKGCLKFVCNEDGRELVIRRDGTVEFRDEFKGTFNYSVPVGLWGNINHMILDMKPYYLYGNTENDSTTIIERLVMTVVGSKFVEDRLNENK